MRFVYSIVRFVPDPARGEFINIGAIAGSEESFEWAVRQIDNPKRARAIDERNSLDAAWSFLDEIGRDIDAFDEATQNNSSSLVEPLTEAWLCQLHGRYRHVVQISRPTPLVAESAEEALDRVFSELVVDPTRKSRPYKDKHAALAALRSAYREVRIPTSINLNSRVLVQSDHQQANLDFSVSNGHALQLAHTWSFQTPKQDVVADQVRSWGWTMREVRRRGGRLVTPQGRLPIESDVEIEVVYVPPNGEQDDIALEAAVEVFDELDVRARPIDDANVVGERARELLRNAGELS